MDAFHSFWSAPQFVRRGDTELHPPAHELLTQMLSALKWKELNGSIFLFADSAWCRFFERTGLLRLYDRIDTTLDALSRSGIAPDSFWAAGKLAALARMPLPCAMLDADIIIWQNLENTLRDQIVCTHSEAVGDPTYPDLRGSLACRNFAFPSQWNWEIPAVNTSFLFWPERLADMRSRYIGEAFRFMKSVDVRFLDPIRAMCFAEQRLLAMLVGAEQEQIGFLLDYDSIVGQNIVTHLWGYKQQLREDRQTAMDYCRRCLARIGKEYPLNLDLAERICDLFP